MIDATFDACVICGRWTRTGWLHVCGRTPTPPPDFPWPPRAPEVD